MAKYTETDKTLLAVFVNMEVQSMQAENDIRKFHGKNMKYDDRDFIKQLNMLISVWGIIKDKQSKSHTLWMRLPKKVIPIMKIFILMIEYSLNIHLQSKDNYY